MNAGMKWGWALLIGLLLTSIWVALLPETPPEKAKLQLRGTTLTLYPSRDAESLWEFSADTVTHDPDTGETHLSGVKTGERYLRIGKQGQKGEKDALMQTGDLTIDREDTISMKQAELTLLRHCAHISLSSRGDQLVKIVQQEGFSAPVAEMDSPQLSGHVEGLNMSFDFAFLEGADPERSHFQYNLDSEETCVNGQRVKVDQHP